MPQIVDEERLVASRVADSAGWVVQTFCTAFAGVAGITSEWWPPSVRNGGRHQIGIPAGIKSEYLAGMRRNLHPDSVGPFIVLILLALLFFAIP